MKRFITPRLIRYLIFGSFGGMLFCHLIEIMFLPKDIHFDQTPIGFWIEGFFEIIFGITAIILVPLSVFMRRSEVKEVQKLWGEGEIDPEELPPAQKHLFYMNYGNVPKWVYLPFVILAAILASVLVLGIIAFILLAIICGGLYLLLFVLHLFGH
jgi:hypothetical protein